MVQHGFPKREIKNTYRHIPFQPELWEAGENLPVVAEQGIILGSIGAKNKVTALVDTDDVHCMMIGASGVGKDGILLIPQSGICLRLGYELFDHRHQG